MKRLINFLLFIAAVCAMSSCTSNDPGKITLAKGQSSDISLYANSTSDEIRFSADDDWTAQLSTTSRGDEDLDWITITNTSGSAGDASIYYSVERNDTESSRTAYVIIGCDDDLKTVKITQTTKENDDDEFIDEPNIINPMHQLFVRLLSFSKAGCRIKDFDGYVYTYDDNGLVDRISHKSDTYTFIYAPERIMVYTNFGKRYEITLNKEILASHIDCYQDEVLESAYDIEYKHESISKFTQYRQGKIYRSTTCRMQGSVITEIETTYNDGTIKTVMLNESETRNHFGLMLYNAQLGMDMGELETFFYCGILGFPTSHMIESTLSVEKKGYNTLYFRTMFNYTYGENGYPVKVEYTEVDDDTDEEISSGSVKLDWENNYN